MTLLFNWWAICVELFIYEWLNFPITRYCMTLERDPNPGLPHEARCHDIVWCHPCLSPLEQKHSKANGVFENTLSEAVSCMFRFLNIFTVSSRPFRRGVYLGVQPFRFFLEMICMRGLFPWIIRAPEFIYGILRPPPSFVSCTLSAPARCVKKHLHLHTH